MFGNGKTQVESAAPVAVPTLDEVASDPTRVMGLPPAVLVDIVARAGAVVAAAQSAMVAKAMPSQQREAAHDNLLNVKQAAARLSVTEDWLYRHAQRLPFTVRLGPGQVRFSAAGIERFIRTRLAQTTA